MNNLIYISIVIPVFNEEDGIKELLTRTGKMLNQTGKPGEIICVDDCSTDSSVEKMLILKASYPIRVIQLLEHTGQSGALAAGFTAARGEYIAMIDADLQCIPEEIPMLMEKMTDNTAAVCGIRTKRNDNLVKKISSRIGNGFRNRLTGEDIADTNCPLKLFRADAIKRFRYFKGFHRFIPTLLKMQGYTVVFTGVTHLERKSGKTKYNIRNRLFKGLFDVLGILWLKKNNIRPEKYKEL